MCCKWTGKSNQPFLPSPSPSLLNGPLSVCVDPYVVNRGASPPRDRSPSDLDSPEKGGREKGNNALLLDRRNRLFFAPSSLSPLLHSLPMRRATSYVPLAAAGDCPSPPCSAIIMCTFAGCRVEVELVVVDRKYHTNFVLNLIVKFRGTCGQVIATFADVKPPSPRISHPFRSVCVCPVMAPTTESRRAVIVKEPQKVGNRSNITTASCSSGNRFSHIVSWFSLRTIAIYCFINCTVSKKN